jgi:multiple sugar transport system substrate-binding protein
MKSGLRIARSALVGVAVVSLMVTACTGGGTSSTSGSAGTQEKITLEVWTWGSVDDTLKILGQKFSAEHPNITIHITQQPQPNYFELVRKAIASHTGPDVFQMFANAGIFDFYRGLVPLTKYVTPEQKRDLVGWENVSTARSADGTPYAVPYLSQGYIWYYNKALFRKAGLDPANPPATWADLLRDCQAFGKAGIVPIINGYADGYGVEQFMDVFMIQRMSQDEIKRNNQKPNWTRQEQIEALKYTQELKDKGCTDPKVAGIKMWPNSLNAFAAGKGAMFQGLLSDVANWAQFRKTLGDDLGVWLGPLLPNAVHPSPPLDFSPNLGWSISAASKHPKESFDWISLVASPEGQAQAFKTNGSMPNTAAAQVTSDYGAAATLLQWIQDPNVVKICGPVPFMRPTVDSTFATTVSGIYTGAISPEALMKQVQAADDQLPPVPQ